MEILIVMLALLGQQPSAQKVEVVLNKKGPISVIELRHPSFGPACEKLGTRLAFPKGLESKQVSFHQHDAAPNPRNGGLTWTVREDAPGDGRAVMVREAEVPEFLRGRGDLFSTHAWTFICAPSGSGGDPDLISLLPKTDSSGEVIYKALTTGR